MKTSVCNWQACVIYITQKQAYIMNYYYLLWLKEIIQYRQDLMILMAD